MKILVDENVPLLSVSNLCEMGHDVLDIRGTDEQGMADEALWKKACQEGRLLITTDKGFAYHRQEEHHGVLIISLRQPNHRKIHKRIIEGMKLFSPERWPGLLGVMRDASMSSWRRKKKNR